MGLIFVSGLFFEKSQSATLLSSNAGLLDSRYTEKRTWWEIRRQREVRGRRDVEM